jgi:TIGR03009 family protein
MRLRQFTLNLLAMLAVGAVLAARGTAQEGSVYAPAPATNYPSAAEQTDAAASAPQQPSTPVAQPAAVPATPVAVTQVAVSSAAPGAPVDPRTPAAAAQPPAPPFQLTEVQQQQVAQILQMWETESAKVQTFNSEFERWEYDGVFGPGSDKPLIKCTGQLSFSKPDKGSLKVETISRWTKTNPQDTAADAPGDWVAQPHEIGEHWVCDGKAVYEYNHRDKQLVVTPIPPQMQGAAIADGPLPFLFGAKAQELMGRYWIKEEQSNAVQVWLRAYPRRQSDAANYDSVDVMLDRKTMQPTHIQVNLPGGQQKHMYTFTNAKVNQSNLGTWFNELFSAPRKPLGWTRVTNEQPAGPQAAAPAEGVQR